MILPARSSRQPVRAPWTPEFLQLKLDLALGAAIQTSTFASYSSAFQSYISFCRSHNFDIEPTPRTMAFYTVYMSDFISPRSVESYLSGICNLLESDFPNARAVRRHPLVVKALIGCKKLRAAPVLRKQPICRSDFTNLQTLYSSSSSSHDDLLFFALLTSGFNGLLRLGELVWPDKVDLRSYRKVMMRHKAKPHSLGFELFLPTHKADRFFEGNQVILRRLDASHDPIAPITRYLTSRDKLYPRRCELWLRSDGSIPLRAWFTRRLKVHFPSGDISGHSMRAGGATALAEEGVSADTLQGIGRWASESFRIYIRKNPVILAAMVHGRSARRAATTPAS